MPAIFARMARSQLNGERRLLPCNSLFLVAPKSSWEGS